MINLTKKQLIIIVGIGVIMLSIIGYYIYTVTQQVNYDEIEIANNEEEQEKQTNESDLEEIVIHISGQVKNPGIVRTKEGARIADIIEQAGGLTDQADITNINLAYIIEDGQKIIIPSKTNEETNTEIAEENYITEKNGEGIIQEQNEKGNTSNTININKANIEELQQLQGIGESTATKIIEYRKQNGNFNNIEDIKNVPGIGDAKFNAIKDNIRVK